jgi:hypothetical protein
MGRRDKALEALRDLYEKALSKSDGFDRYIPQICDHLRRNKLEKDVEKNKQVITKMLDDVANKLTNPGFWVNGKVITGDHGGIVGKTGDGCSIIKRDTDKATRIFFIRYVNKENGRVYIRLLGYQLSGERDKGWPHEVREINRRYRGEVSSGIEELLDDSNGGGPDEVSRDSHVLKIHGGYITIGGQTELTKTYIDDLLHMANIIITDDQLLQIAKSEPLLIDGHAGTGKSVIIALRIAVHYATFDKTKGNENKLIPSLLVVAYNKRVLNMIKDYVGYWIRKMIHQGNEKYLDRISYIPTLQLYHMLLNKQDYYNIPDPLLNESTETFVNFYRFQSEFFSRRNDFTGISAEQAWHFIRGILKGRELGWYGSGEPITIDDFGSITGKPDSKIPRKSTEKMSKELILSLLDVHTKYESWRVENGYLDDIDLVRKALDSIEDGTSRKDEFIKKFDTVLIDEGQDLTIVEFKLITYLLRKYSESVNIVVGGDPLQTINPTGFSWENLETFITERVHEEQGNNKFKMEDNHTMVVSHRMPKTLVDFSNIIIKSRARLSNENLELMKALDDLSNDGSITRVPYDSNDEQQRNTVNEFLAAALGSDIGTIIWARDKKELDDVKSKDSTLTDLVATKTDEGLLKEDIHSIESVKGLEFETVILYRFGDLSQNFQTLAESSLSATETHDSEEAYESLYFLNRLFIASTRSKKNLIIIDSQDSMEKSWNEKLWQGTAHNIVSLEDFIEEFETEPTLDKANHYYVMGKERKDLDLLHKALASAKQCPDTGERDDLITNIEIITLELEVSLPMFGEKEKLNKRKRLIALYEKVDDHEKAIYERIINNDWEVIYQTYKQRPQYKLPWLVSAVNQTNDPKHLKELISIFDDYIGEIKKAAAKKELRRVYLSLCRENLASLDVAELEKIHQNISNPDDWIKILSPNWKPKGNKSANDRILERFLKNMRIKFGRNEETWTPKVFIKIYRIQLDNPDISDKDNSKVVEDLANKGDTDAIKTALNNIFQQGSPSITSKKWNTIAQLLESAVIPLDENENDRKILENRLSMISSIIKLKKDYVRTPIKDEWKKAMQTINSLANNRNITKASMQEISFVSGQGPTWIGFSTILDIDEKGIDELINFMLLILTSDSGYGLRQIIEWDWENELQYIFELFSNSSNLTTNLIHAFEQIIQAITTSPTQIFSSEMVRFILDYLNLAKSKKLKNKRLFINNIQKLFERHDWYDWYWRYPKVIQTWLRGDFRDDDGAEYQTKLGFHVLVKRWKDDDDNVDITDLLALAHHAKPELAIEIKEAAGYDNAQLISDLIKTMNLDKLREQQESDVISVINNEEYLMNEILWQNNNWFKQNVEMISSDSSEIEDSLKKIVYHSVFNDSLASSIIQTFPQSDDASYNQIPITMLESFWKYLADSLNEQIQIEWQKGPFWEHMMRDGTVLSDALSLPTRRKGKQNFDINALAVIDVMLMMSKLSSDKKRVKYLNDIGLISKSNYTKSELKDALFSTELFQLIFIEEPELLVDAKNLI